MTFPESSTEVLRTMLVDSVGAGNRLTPESRTIAGAEVTLRLEAARQILSGEIREVHCADPHAMTAVIMMWYGAEL